MNRTAHPRGACQETQLMRAGRADLHIWEEPPLAACGGSGAIFFSGCSLHCLYCQNEALSQKHVGYELDITRAEEIMHELAEKGAQNINIVSGTHFTPSIIAAIKCAKANGLSIPVVWNSSGYEALETIQQLKEVVDIWLCDMKYGSAEVAQALSSAPDYPEVAYNALVEIAAHLENGPHLTFGANGDMQTGLIVRHLVLPGFLENTFQALAQIKEAIGTEYPLSLMSQYTPNSWALKQKAYPSLAHTLDQKSYDKALAKATALGFSTIYTQDLSSSRQSFLPKFDGEGIRAHTHTI